MSKTFSAQVSDWVLKSERRMTAVFKQSAQDVLSIAQTPVASGGNMPVDTGFLRASLQSDLNGMPVGTSAESYVLAVAGAKLGDTIGAEWTANYALPVEFGARGRSGRLFMNSAAQQWSGIVVRNAAKA